MKKSKISILLLFLVMILAISAVSAADTNDTSDSAVQAVDEAPVDEVASSDVDAVAATDDAAVLSTGGQNFTQLQTEVNTGTVLMSDDFVRQDGENTISINRDVTVLGNGHKIDGSNLGGIFNVNSECTLTLMGVTLINGNAENGGAIYNNGGTLTIVNSYFLNNTATHSGGAIYSNGGSVTVSGSTFDGNDLTDRSINDDGGAAIYGNASEVLISTSTITNNLKNIVHRGGTGSYTGDLSSAAVTNIDGTLTVTDSYFGNNSGSYGGAILSKGTNSKLVVSGSNFENNFAFNGGAIDCPNGNYLITSSNFTGNKVRGTGSATGTFNNKNYLAHGGAIAATETAECIISDCIFKNNSASVGGAISTKNTKVVGCTFINNSAEAAYSETVNGNPNNVGGFGAAVYSDSVMTIDDSTFINNTNTRNDGLYLRESTVTDSSFTNTIIFGNSKPLTISNNTYDNEGVDISGDPKVYFDGVGDIPKFAGTNYIYFNATSFASLKAMIDAKPQRIYLTGDVTKLASEEEAFANGILVNVDTYIDLQGHTITSNNGKVFTVNESGSLSLYNGNVVGDGTSAIVNKGTVTLSLTNPATFTNVGEFAIDNQGTIEVKEKLTTFTQLNNLIALISGGEIYLNQYRYEITKTDAEKDAFANGIVIDKNLTIRGVISSSRGIDTKINANNDGRIFTVTNGATLTLQKVILQNGIAENGGAVYVNAGATLNTNTVAFKDNTATNRGGAIWSTGTLNIKDTSFDKNDITNRTKNVDNGGAAIFSNGTLDVDHSRFTNNLLGYVVRTGDNNNPQLIDGVVLSSGVAVVNNSYFENNRGTYGAGITAVPIKSLGSTFTSLTVENSEFVNNLAYNGAGINVNADGSGRAAYLINNCTFIGNNATGIGSPGTPSSGGAVFIARDTEGTVTGSRFYNNTATLGGAISISAASSAKGVLNAVVDNCIFENNTAVGSVDSEAIGGAIRIGGQAASDKMVVSVKNSKFTNNVAADGGSAVYNNGTLALSGNTADAGSDIKSAGTITSPVIAVVTADDTSYHIEQITLTARLTDDSGIVINDTTFKFVFNSPAGLAAIPATLGDDGNYTVKFTPTKHGEYNVTVNHAGDITNATFTVYRTLTDLKELVENAADGDTIILDSDYTYNDKFDASFTGILTRSSVTINGTGYTICGQDKTCDLFIVDGHKLTLNNLTICHFNNTVDGTGGAISVSPSGILTANYVNFTDNTAKYKGGAIYNDGGTVIVNHTVFDGNDIEYRASRDNKDFNGGAAIYNLEGTLTVDNSKFINNVKNYGIRSAADYDNLDGAVTSISGTANITNSEFRNNSARYGSAILISSSIDDDCTFTIDNCQFYDNFALAGAIQVWDRFKKFEFTVLNSWFENNTATGITDSTHTAAGGAITLINVREAKINGTTFKENKVTNIAKKPKGGAINIQDSTVEIDYCTFEANHADTNGGAINVYSGSVDVNNSKFINNNATINGGAINIENNTAVGVAAAVATVENSNFTGNTATNGSAIFSAGALTLSGNKVFSDEAEIESTGTVTADLYVVLIGGEEIPADLGETVYPNATLTDGYNLIYDHKFNITVDGKELETIFVDGVYVAEYTIETAGDKNVSTNYRATSVTNGKYVVDRANVTSFIVEVNDIVQGENATVEIALVGVNNEGLNATVTVYIDNKPITITVQDGYGSKNVSGLDAGQYPVFAQFIDANGNYNTAYNSTVFYVKSTQANLTVEIEDIKYGEVVTVNIYLTDANGNPLTAIVALNIAGEDYYVPVIEGNASLDIPEKLNVDRYNYTATFENELYNTTIYENSFNVMPREVYLAVRTDDGVAVGEEGEIKVVIYDDDDNVFDGEEVELTFTNKTGDIVGACTILTSDNIQGPQGSYTIDLTKDWKIGMYYVAVKSKNFIFKQPSEDEDDEDEAPAYYQFTSYAGDGTEWGTGIAVVLDEKILGYIPVGVVSNSYSDEFVGEVFFIVDSAVADGETLYELHNRSTGDGIGVWVKVSPAFEYPVHKKAIDAVVIEGDGEYVYGGEHIVVIDLGEYGDYYGFTSYGDEACTIEYGTGIVEVDDRVGDYISVKVLSNDFDDRFVGQTFYVLDDEYGEDEPIQLSMMNDNNEIVPVDLWVKVSELRGYSKLINITCPATVVVLWDDDNKTIETEFINGRLSVDLSDLKPGEYTLIVEIDDATYELHSYDYDRDIDYPYALLYPDDYFFRVVEDHVYVNNVNGKDWTQYGEERIFNFELWHHYWTEDDDVDELFVYNTTAGVIIYKVVRDENGTIISTDELDSYVVNITDGISGSINLTYLNAGEYKVIVILNDTNYVIEGWDDDVSIIYEYTSYNEDETVEYGSGTVKVIGDAEDGYIQVEVISNVPDGSFDGQLFYIKENAKEDGETLNQLYIMNGTEGIVPVEIWVKVSNLVDKNTPWYAEHFNVNKAGVEVHVDLNGSITYGENETVTVTVVTPTGEKLNETVEINIMGKESFNVTLVNGTVTFNLTGYDVGTYTIWVNFFGTDNFWDSYNNINGFSVDKATPQVSVADVEIHYGNDAVINVNVIGVIDDIVQGTVIVTVNGTEYIVKDGKVTVPAGLASGVYNITARFIGNDNYNEATNDTAKLNITASEVTIVTISVTNVTYGIEPTVTITLKDGEGKNISGLVDVSIGGLTGINKVNVDGVANYTLGVMNVGSYNITASIDGVSDIAFFTVDKANNATINVVPNEPTYGEAANITVSAFDGTAPIAGKAYVTVDGTPLEGGYPIDGATVIGLGNLTGGVHTIEVKFVSDNYATVIEFTSVTVGKAAPEIAITDIAGSVGDTVEANVTIAGGDATGLIFFNGEVYIVKDGKATIPVKLLTAGMQTITVIYTGDDNYRNGTANKEFKVVSPTSISTDIVNGSSVDACEDMTVEVTVDPAVNGTYSLWIDGLVPDYGPLTVQDGKGSLIILSGDLTAGKHNITVQFVGDEFYMASEKVTYVFTAVKKDSIITITTGDVVVDEPLDVTITIGNLTGDVTVDGDVYQGTVTLTNGKGTFTIAKENMTFGQKSIRVRVSNNDKYADNSTSYDFEVEKAENYTFELNITVPEINAGENLTFNVTLPEDANGIVNVTVDGESAALANVINGNATVEIPAEAFTAGRNNTIEVIFEPAGDKYNRTSVETEIYVSKLDYDLTATAQNIELGQNVTIVVNLPEGADGRIYAELQGSMYPGADGKIIIENLTVGTYTAYVLFIGDSIYKDNQTKVTFNVTKVVIPAEDAFNITTPENATAPEFTIKLPEDATGFLLLDINGTQTFVPLVNGTATARVPEGFAPGNYSAVVTYTGDNKYDPITTTQNITVTSNVPDNAFTIPDTAKDGEPLTYAINLPSDAKGYLEVDVDGTKHVVALVNGSASITVPGLSAGNHNVTVSYTGDGKYSPVTKSMAMNVSAPVYKITNNNNVAAIYSANANYKVLITKDGKAVGAGESVNIVFNGKTYTVKTDSKGYATLNLNTKVKVKTYTVTAEYKGVKVSNKVTIKHVIKAKNVNVKKSKKVNKIKVKTNKVNGKFLKGKKLTLKIKGKKIKAKINKKGVATFKVKKSVLKKLKVGKKYKYTVTYGKDKVTKKVKVKR